MLIRILLVALLAVPAAAQDTWYVDVASDGPPFDGAGWHTAFVDLQQGIEAAATGDLIKVAQGTYRPSTGDPGISFDLKEGLTIQGGYAGCGEQDPDLRDIDTYLTVLCGDLDDNDLPNFQNREDNSFHVVRMSLPGGGNPATLDGVTVRGGYADVLAADEMGGGLFILDDASVVLLECRLTDNFALTSGGGLHGENGSVRLESCLVDSNLVSGGGDCFAGPCRGAGLSTQVGTLEIVECRFEDNTVGPGFLSVLGGGLYAEVAFIDLCVFESNTANGGLLGTPAFGGGVYAYSATVNDTTFVLNKAEAEGGAEGAGMWAWKTVSTSCVWSDNDAISWANTARGGGLCATGSALEPCTIDRCQFTGNEVGAEWVGMGGGLNLSVGVAKGCVFDYNTAHGNLDGVGGGMGSTGEVHLSACGFFGNDSEHGGGLALLGTGTTVDDCVFSANSASGDFADGGAVFGGDNPPTDPILSGCSVSENTSDVTAGGLALRGSSRVYNGIFWGNSDASGQGETAQITTTFPPVVHFCDIMNLGGIYGALFGNIGVDPRFRDPDGPDGLPGTADDDLRLLPDSPCRGAGNDTLRVSDWADIDDDDDIVELSPLDYDYRPRPLQTIEMGAFELNLNATCTWYCGTDVNAPTDGYVITDLAVLGGTFSASVTGCAPGNAGGFLIAYSTPLTLPSPWGEILVNIGDPSGELLGMPSAFGNPAIINVLVPNDPLFAGFVFYTQAASFGGTICLHCAHECSVGV